MFWLVLFSSARLFVDSLTSPHPSRWNTWMSVSLSPSARPPSLSLFPSRTKGCWSCKCLMEREREREREREKVRCFFLSPRPPRSVTPETPATVTTTTKTKTIEWTKSDRLEKFLVFSFCRRCRCCFCYFGYYWCCCFLFDLFFGGFPTRTLLIAAVTTMTARQIQLNVKPPRYFIFFCFQELIRFYLFFF